MNGPNAEFNIPYGKDNPPPKGTPIEITYPAKDGEPEAKVYGFYHLSLNTPDHGKVWEVCPFRDDWNLRNNALPEWCKVITQEEMIRGVIRSLFKDRFADVFVYDDEIKIQISSITLEQLKKLSKEFKTEDVKMVLGSDGTYWANPNITIEIKNYKFRGLENKERHF
jgi:hypothetical protein